MNINWLAVGKVGLTVVLAIAGMQGIEAVKAPSTQTTPVAASTACLTKDDLASLKGLITVSIPKDAVKVILPEQGINVKVKYEK